MGTNGEIGRNSLRHQVGPLPFQSRIGVLAPIAVGPTIKATFLHANDIVGDQIVAQLIALINGSP